MAWKECRIYLKHPKTTPWKRLEPDGFQVRNLLETRGTFSVSISIFGGVKSKKFVYLNQSNPESFASTRTTGTLNRRQPWIWQNLRQISSALKSAVSGTRPGRVLGWGVLGAEAYHQVERTAAEADTLGILWGSPYEFCGENAWFRDAFPLHKSKYCLVQPQIRIGSRTCNCMLAINSFKNVHVPDYVLTEGNKRRRCMYPVPVLLAYWNSQHDMLWKLTLLDAPSCSTYLRQQLEKNLLRLQLVTQKGWSYCNSAFKEKKGWILASLTLFHPIHSVHSHCMN